MKISSCLTALFLFLPLLLAQQPLKTQQQQQQQKVDASVAKPGLHDILLKTVHDTASYLGFGVKCRNGGHKTEENTCICPKYYYGKECETKVCINGGKPEKSLVPTVHMVCKCPNPEFITGEHCEKIKCANQGVLRVFPANSTWQCDCSETKFFGSTFCEKLIVSSLWSIVAGCILLLICVVCLCSANWFNRDRGRRRRHPTNRCMSTGDGTSGHSAGMRDTGRRAWPAQAQRGTRVNPRGGPSSSTHRSSSSDELISSERGAHRRTAAFPSGNITQQYVVRLDTIPTFNPAMIGGVEPTGAPLQQDMGPPPSYDQAMSSIHAEPPVYTPTDAAKQNA